jgi:UDP-glucose 4-epimerase
LKAVLTGGAGFIGSHIADDLIDKGVEVLVIDDLSSGSLSNLSKRVEFLNLNIADRKLSDGLKNFKADMLIHCAAQASVSHSIHAPAFDAEVNILNGLKIMNYAMESGVGSYVYLNTGGALYGEPQYLPCDEQHPINPISPYGLSKWTLENYFDLLLPASAKFTSLRLANVYGPRQDPGGEAGVVAIFAQKMLNGEDIKIFGDGDQSRDFVYVKDVVASVIAALETGVQGHINIGSGEQTSVNQIFEHLSSEIGYTTPPIYESEREGDVRHIYLSIEKAKEDLGWTAKMNLEEGLKQTVNILRHR